MDLGQWEVNLSSSSQILDLWDPILSIGVVIRPLTVAFKPLRVNFRLLGIYFDLKKLIIRLYGPILDVFQI